MLFKVHESPYQGCETRPYTFHTSCVSWKHFPGVCFNLGKLFMSQVLISSARRCLAERLWAHCKRLRKILFYAGHLYPEGFSWQRMDPNSRLSSGKRKAVAVSAFKWVKERGDSTEPGHVQWATTRLLLGAPFLTSQTTPKMKMLTLFVSSFPRISPPIHLCRTLFKLAILNHMPLYKTKNK